MGGNEQSAKTHYCGTKAKNPVNNPPFNNWSVNQPSVPHNKGMKGTEDLEQRDIIIDGVNYDF